MSITAVISGKTLRHSSASVAEPGQPDTTNGTARDPKPDANGRR